MTLKNKVDHKRKITQRVERKKTKNKKFLQKKS